MTEVPPDDAPQYDLEPTLAELEFEGAGPEAADAPLVRTAPLPNGVRLTVPRRGADPISDALAVANESARADALGRLGEWFTGYDIHAAAQTTDDRRFVLINLDGSLLEHLDAMSALTRIIGNQEHSWGPGGVSFVHGEETGHRPPPAYVVRSAAQRNMGRIDLGGLVEALRQDWTVVVNGADRFDPALAEVCDDLSRAYGSRINTNVYISWTGAKGFGDHWDSHDTIIVPVHGAKEWSVFAPTKLSAQRPWVGPATSDQPVWAGRVEPGQCLVIPRGWGHTVAGTGELSVHYTIGVNRLEVRSLINRVGWEAGYWPLMRADVPFDHTEDVVSYEGSLLDQPDQFGEALRTIGTPEMVDWAIATHRARISARRFPDLAGTFRAGAADDWAGLRLRMAVPSGLQYAGHQGESIAVAFDNRVVLVDRSAFEALVTVSNGRAVGVSDLPAVGPTGADQRGEFARQLVLGGLAAVELV